MINLSGGKAVLSFPDLLQQHSPEEIANHDCRNDSRCTPLSQDGPGWYFCKVSLVKRVWS